MGEFSVVSSRDEISFGVTYDAGVVEKCSGFGNVGIKTTWLYSKKKSMPVLLFGGSRPRPPPSGDVVPGVQQGDRIAVYCDPQERFVKFYRNGELVASNLPDHPLPCEAELE